MAGERKGPRQPLSRVRPGAAKKKPKGTSPIPSGNARSGKPAAPGTSPGRAVGGTPAARRTDGSAAAEAEKPTGGPPQKERSPRQRSRAASVPRPPKRSAAPRRAPAPPAETFRRLQATYPDAHCALHHANAYQLLVATILSAQCTDARVNMVTPALFARFPDAHALAGAEASELEELIRSTGFFRSKTKSLLGMAQAVVERHGGEIPDTMDALTRLPGVGRKTANVILGNAFGKNEGIVVDTHVTRLSNRLGFTVQQDPVKIEQDLIGLFPRAHWTLLSHLLIDHGRAICIARAPKCPQCPLADLCPTALV